jgi:pyridoxamine 5'-phosphate oxidase
LFKGFRDEDVIFFTNFESRKSRELAENPAVAAVFYWAHLERQLRIEGKVEKLTREENERYFRTRPREAQIGAWASPQSQPIGGRDDLEQRVAAMATRFGEEEVPCPPNWGGFAIKISAIEFWQAGAARLHTRNRYERSGASWLHQILAP